MTHRDAHGKGSALNKALGWPVLLQEQEAYLLPHIKNIETFEDEFSTDSNLRLLWTPGPTPGSCVVYAPSPWNVLFCGRLLIPVAKDQINSFRSKTTFHWTLQEESIRKLLGWLPRDRSPVLASSKLIDVPDYEGILPWDAWNSNFI